MAVNATCPECQLCWTDDRRVHLKLIRAGDSTALPQLPLRETLVETAPGREPISIARTGSLATAWERRTLMVRRAPMLWRARRATAESQEAARGNVVQSIDRPSHDVPKTIRRRRTVTDQSSIEVPEKPPRLDTAKIAGQCDEQQGCGPEGRQQQHANNYHEHEPLVGRPMSRKGSGGRSDVPKGLISHRF